MADSGPLASTLAARGHGRLLRAVKLKGELTLHDGASSPATLAQTDLGVWLCAGDGENAVIRDVLDAYPMRYESRMFGDKLTLGAESFGVPLARSAEARAALGAGKVRKEHSEGPSLGEARVPRGPWIDSTSPTEEAWLDAALDPDEPVLAWLHTSLTTSFEGSMEPGCEAAWRLLVTRDRVALVAVSALGDVEVAALPDAPLQIAGGRGARIQAGDHSWEPVGNTSEFLQVAPIPGVLGAERLRLAAARARQSGREGEVLSDHLLTRLLPDNAPIDRLISATRTRPVREGEVLRAVREIPRDDDGAQRLADWFRSWSPDLELARAVLAALLEDADGDDEAAWALPLHRALRDRVVQSSKDPFEQAEADIALAEHLLYAGEAAEARGLLLARRPALPDEELASVLPPEDADLTAGEAGQPVHIRLLELLARTRAEGVGDPSALAALARHQPLVRPRLERLVEADAGDLSSRAQLALRALAPGGLALADSSEATPAHRFRTLPDPLLPSIQHPAAREGGVLHQVQSAVARVQPPEVGVLRSYCERVSAQRHPAVKAAVRDACVVLGLPIVDAFVSAGDRRVGLRSHESPEPFLVLGAAHLDPDEDVYLRPAELRAAVGAEVAHLRFGHSRITSNDIWAGLMDKGATAITATAALLPFLRFLPVDSLGTDRTWKAVRSVVPQSWLRAVYGVDDAVALATVVPSDLGRLGNAGAGAIDSASGTLTSLQTAARKLLPGSPDQAVPADVGLDNARLVAAHRVMQLTADRAGLVLSGDLRSSIRALFLTHTRLSRELAVTDEHGLTAALSRRGPDERLVLPDLAVRIAALVAFWLSDDFARLRDAARGPADAEARG